MDWIAGKCRPNSTKEFDQKGQYRKVLIFFVFVFVWRRSVQPLVLPPRPLRRPPLWTISTDSTSLSVYACPMHLWLINRAFTCKSNNTIIIWELPKSLSRMVQGEIIFLCYFSKYGNWRFFLMFDKDKYTYLL